MKKILVITAVVLFSLCLSTSALAQNKEIRVLLANHPYGDLLKTAIPEFEKATGIRVKVESLQEGQLTTKLTTEFATRSSSVDVFMTRPLQEGKMFYKNGWYEPLNMDFADYPKNVMSVSTFASKAYIVPLVTEWQVLYYRKDLFRKAGIKVPTNFTELEAAARKLNSESVAGIASRGKGAAAVTQLSSYVYNYGGLYLDKGTAVFASKPAVEAIRFYGKLLGNYGPKGVTSMSWENIMPLFQAGKIAMWTDASVFYGEIVDPAKTQVASRQCRDSQLPERSEDELAVYRDLVGHGGRQAIEEQGCGDAFPAVGDEQGNGYQGDACQHHGGALLHMARQGSIGQGKQGTRRDPCLCRPTRQSAGSPVHERSRRSPRSDRRTDHRIDQHQGLVAESGKDGGGKGRQGERNPQGNRGIWAVVVCRFRPPVDAGPVAGTRSMTL